MKNVNLTGLYLDLIATANVSGFEVSSVRKTDSIEPSDIMIDYGRRDNSPVAEDVLKGILTKNITGEVKKATINITNTNTVHVYVEFMNSDFGD